MAALAQARYDVVTVADAASLLGRPADGRRRVIGLSFDDGYRDVAENALPVLERHGFRATVFVATGVVDGTSRFTWFDDHPPVLGWGEIGELDGGTLEFEAHTVTHPNLVAVGDEQVRVEVAESKRVLEQRLGRPVATFCYPAGLFGARERSAVADAGFAWATSCEPGVNTRATDPLALRRIQIDRRDRLVDFRAKVAGAHDRPLPLRSVYRRRRYGASGGRER